MWRDSIINHSQKDFKEVIAFSVSEPGAMGPNDIGFFLKNGSFFRLDYKINSQTPWNRIREWFPTLKECFFNGARKNEIESLYTVVIGAEVDEKKTHIPPGWRHVYLDMGNHLVIKEEYYHEVMRLIGKKSKIDLAFSWEGFLSRTDFTERIDEIETAYWEEKAKDEKLTKVLEQLRNNPEYNEKVKSVSDDVEAMAAVLKEYSGIDMTWIELKQYCFRRLGLV